MAELKTKATTASVSRFLEALPEPQRTDCLTLADLMRKATRAEPVMWGTSIIGFGRCHYVYASGREGDWFQIGFSPRKQSLTLYLMGGLESHASLLEKLGRHKTGKGCLYINRLPDIHLPILRKIIAGAVQQARQMDKA